MEEISQGTFLFQIVDSPNNYLNHNYNSLNLKSIIIIIKIKSNYGQTQVGAQGGLGPPPGPKDFFFFFIVIICLILVVGPPSKTLDPPSPQ